MPARLILALRWVALAVIVLAVVVIVLRRKLPPRPRMVSQPAPNFWRELWLRWLDAREDSRERAANMRALRGKRVIIADPDEKSARVLTWRLHRLRCSVHRARTATQALKLARELDPGLIVADALLADMNAAEFYQSLPRQSIPVVFVGVLRSQWDQIRSLGRDVACLAKPYDPDDVASFAGMAIRRNA